MQKLGIVGMQKVIPDSDFVGYYNEMRVINWPSRDPDQKLYIFIYTYPHFYSPYFTLSYFIPTILARRYKYLIYMEK